MEFSAVQSLKYITLDIRIKDNDDNSHKKRMYLIQIASKTHARAIEEDKTIKKNKSSRHTSDELSSSFT